VKEGYPIELNGYSNFRVGTVKEQTVENFTLTLLLTPYTYETKPSGVLSAYFAPEKKGLAIEAGKRGIVRVTVGLGNTIFEIESLVSQLHYQKQNIVTVAFWGTAGWCDLCVNGILSNRKQFARHSVMQIPEGEYYIGKYVDGLRMKKDTRHGVFHGRISMIEYKETYLPCDEVIAFQNSQQLATEEIGLYRNCNAAEDIYRPAFHMMPPGKWMNEPHAPFYYKGYYHIFYQANPHAPVWDNLCWGHLVSTDMVHWEYGGIALCPDEDPPESGAQLAEVDLDGCWSGSACMDETGVPVLFYTAGNNRQLPNQSVAIARPKDASDAVLKCWEKQGVVLRQSPREGFLGEFRDPFVFRRGGLYYILVGSGDAENGGGNALVYTSKDLKEFECRGFAVDYEYEKCTEVGHIWELPVLLPLRDERGEYACDILLFCACQIEAGVVETYYFLGEFDEKQGRFHKYHEIPYLIDLGCGTFTGPSGFVTPDKRTVVFTIAQGKRHPHDEYVSGWAHNGGIPVELSCVKDALLISPIREMQASFKRKLFEAAGKRDSELSQELGKIPLLENRIRAVSDGESLRLILDSGADRYEISYDRRTALFQAVRCGTGDVLSKCRGEQDLVVLDEESIEMECFLDHSMIEVYLNRRKSMTLRNYLYEDVYHLKVKTDGMCGIAVWGL